MRRSVIIISLLLILTAFSPSKHNTKTITADNNQQTIALKSYRHLHYITVKINGKDANLLLDTGAAWTLFDINEAKYYGFNYKQSTNLMIGVGGVKTRYTLSNYKVHHQEYQLLIKSYGADIGDLTKSFSANGVDIVGVIGSDYLTMSNAVIDYKNRTLVIDR